VLNEHGKELGVELTEDAPGLGGQPLVEPSVVFPELERQLHLPARALQHQGLVEATFDERLRVNGVAVPVHDYPRFDNPYGTWDFESPTVDLAFGDSALFLDFESGERTLTPPATPTVRTR
jgi:hypothetical protein